MSLVSMIDVLMIMLVFFMVTSTFLDLDMLPLAAPADDAAGDTADGAGPDAATPDGDGSVGVPVGPVLVRIGGDGRVHLGGRAVAPDTLAGAIRTALAARPGATLAILPSGHARTGDLVRVMDAALAAGTETIRLLRIEGRP